MYQKKIVCLIALLVGIVWLGEASGQQNNDSQMKEVSLAANAFTLADPVPSWVDATAIPENSKSDPIVLRLVDTQFLIGDVPVTYVRRAMLINDPASLTAAGRFSISFAPEYERVQLHGIYVYRGQDRLDRTKSSTIRFLQREQQLEGGVYTGRTTASVLIEDLRVGDTIEVSYSTYGQNPVFGGKFMGSAGWDQAFPTLLRRVVLNAPVARPVNWRMIGDKPSQPVVPVDTTSDGMRKIAFEQRAFPEATGEPLMSPDFFAARFLQFSEFSTWSDVAKWANSLFPSPDVSEGIHEIAQKIRTQNSDEERVSAALEFVQTEIRYFSVSFGESSHRPAAPAEVLRRRYGDCKDKSYLLIALLRELGISSRPVLLNIGRKTGLEKTLPSVQFFDHAIVEVSLAGKNFYLDPTRLGQHGRLESMGQAHERKQVLMVQPDTTALTTIATGNISELVQQDSSERAALAKFGEEGSLQTKIVWHGIQAENFRVIYDRVSREKFSQFMGTAMERRYPGATLVGAPEVEDDRKNNIFSLAAAYKIPKLALERNGPWVVYFAPDNFKGTVLPSPIAKRTTPLQIPGYPFHGTYSFEVTFPDEVSAIADPHAETVKDKYFNATITKSFRGNIAKASLDLETLAPLVDIQDTAKYDEDIFAFEKAIGGYFAVDKTWIKSTDAASEGQLPERLRKLREDLITKTTETIAGGKLSGSDLADAYCARSNAYSDLQRYEDAERDNNEALRPVPNSATALTCRALNYFNAGNFEKSVVDYSKALSLGANASEIFRFRGSSKLYLGRLEEAKSDLEKASELADKETKTYVDLWLVAVSGRMGAPFPDAVVKRAAAESHGEWPRPALAMMTGAISPEELIKLMDEKKGDDRQMALAEGYFYLGQHYLVEKDLKASRDYFQKARDQNVFIYVEHVAAGFELDRLKATGLNSAATPAAH